MEHAKVRQGSSVAVFGCGGIGLNIVQGARMAGATTIVAVDTVASKLDYARKLGATATVDPSESGTDPVEAIRDLTGGQGVDYAFEAIGKAAPIEQAYDSVRKGGTCVVAGISPPDERAKINVNQLVYGEKTLAGSLYGSARPRIDLLTLIDLHRSGKLQLDELLTRTYPLSKINQAYDALAAGEVARSLILPQEEDTDTGSDPNGA